MYVNVAQILDRLDRTPRIDLVVLGTHGRTGIDRFISGSVAEKVVRHATCAALVAHHRTPA